MHVTTRQQLVSSRFGSVVLRRNLVVLRFAHNVLSALFWVLELLKAPTLPVRWPDAAHIQEITGYCKSCTRLSTGYLRTYPESLPRWSVADADLEPN